jgi:CelD/BcsL family acetyltransferase involved in cellulose biosynthesis
MKPKTTSGAIKVLQPDLRFQHGPENPFLAVKELIAKHVGAAKAVSIERIAQELWPVEWNYTHLDKNMPEYPHRAEIQRLVKKIVQQLRRKDKRMGSARAGKNGPPGYYRISTDQELVDTLKPFFRQALTMLRTVHEMTGMDLFIPELTGKLRELANQKLSENRVQE